jgi:hemolysin activation/secretion protein
VRNRIVPIASVQAVALATLLSPTIVAAQAVPTAQQLAPTREEVTRVQPQQAPKAARLTVDGGIERAPCALDDPAYADIKVTITAAEFNNLQGVTPDELRPAYAAFLGQARPISTICTIRDAAATILRDKGYLAAVQVPTQKIENGIVKFEVLFAKIVAIRVRGDAGNSEKILAGYLSKLNNGQVFNRFEAERYLLLARDVPGMDVRLSLKPADTVPGELVGEVSVVRTPLDVDANIQNFASRGTGRWSGLVRGQVYGLIGNGDRLTGSLSSTADFKEQQIAQLGYDMKLGHEGLTIGGNLTYAWTKPDIGPGLPDLKARTLFATGSLSYPVVRSQKFSLSLTSGLDYLNQSVKFAGVDLTRDHLRVGFLRADFEANDVSEQRVQRWRAAGSLEFRHGFDIFGASSGGSTGSVATSRPLADPTASLIRFQGQAEIDMGRGVRFAVLPRAQYAFDRLLSFEQFSTGNYSVGRGYDPGTTIGDSGLGSSFEFRWNYFSPLPRYNFQIQPFVFTDAALTWIKSQPGVATDRDGIISLGGGLHAALNNRFRLDATVAVPMRAAGAQTHRHDPRFLISLSTKLWPWGAR